MPHGQVGPSPARDREEEARLFPWKEHAHPCRRASLGTRTKLGEQTKGSACPLRAVACDSDGIPVPGWGLFSPETDTLFTNSWAAALSVTMSFVVSVAHVGRSREDGGALGAGCPALTLNDLVEGMSEHPAAQTCSQL